MINSTFHSVPRTVKHFVLCAAVLVLVLVLYQTPALAESSKTEPFLPGTMTEIITVNADSSKLSAIGNSRLVLEQDMRQFNRDDVGDALNLLSGVTLSTNSRNEKMISVRGFDSREVPLFIDGIPVYVPYDGYVDLDRFTTLDLAAIQVAKGFSSMSYGANTLGGAINLVSRKPVEMFEGNISAGFGTGDKRKVSTNIGTNQGAWYLQAGASYLQRDGFELSKDFVPTPTEDGGERNNDYRRDSKQSLKVGFTPNASDEYSISYQRQEGKKGQPPSTDLKEARYWRWPIWDKESLYFISNTALSNTETLKVRLYQDRFDNEVNSYTDDNYTTLKTSGKGSVGTGRSIYEDLTMGGSVELESDYFNGHTLSLISHFKNDKHEEFDATGDKNTDYKDTLQSFAIEDKISLTDILTLSLGAARYELTPKKVYNKKNDYTVPQKSTANDVQAGLFYDYSKQARFYVTVAKKTRLPSLKDRYSQRLGTYIENPDLQAEKSINYEIGYQGQPWQGANVNSAIFYSDISNKIQSVADVEGILKQMQNIGEVRSSGFEFGITDALTSWLDLGANYTYINLENVSNSPNAAKRRLTNVPKNKFTAHAVIHPTESIDVIAFVEHNSDRWASDTVELSEFTTLNLKLAYQLKENIAFDAGVNNINDKNYSLADGFPSAGRIWFINASYQF